MNTSTGGSLTLGVGSGSPLISNNVATTIGTVLAGTKGFKKDGTGMLALTNANTYNGITTVTGGILDIQNAQSLGTSSVTINNNNGAILQLDGGIAVNGRSPLNFNTQTGANGLQAGSGAMSGRGRSR